MNKNVGDSVFKIAPERESEFGKTLTNFDLIYQSERQWKCCANPETRAIFVSRGAVELLWCGSLAHFLFYERLIQGKHFDRPTQIDPQSDPLVRDSMELLRWALNCQLTGDNSDDWPSNLPLPLEAPPIESNENVADELCLVSCAFLLHHEFAHIRSRHVAGQKRALSLSQEKEADIAAAEWILDGVQTQDRKFVKRMLGIVQPLLLTIATGLYRGNLGGNTHPFTYDRLASLLDRFRSDFSHDIKTFTFYVLALYFQNSGRRLRRSKFNDPDEALEAIFNQLADEFHGR